MQDKDLYVLAVLKYKKQNPNLKADDIFPIEWNISNNYYIKNIILADAIKNNVLVENTKLYQKYFNENQNVSDEIFNQE